ncbi:MAG: hypothetical protein ACI9MR_002826, partial [Myxococcota bacterium]
MRVALNACVLTLCLSASDANASDITVDTTDAVAAVGNGSCSLREALMNANADMDLTGGDCAAGAGPDTVILQLGATYTFTGPDNWWFGPNALPAIMSDVTVEGNGAVIERAAGAPGFRFFYVAGFPVVTPLISTVSAGTLTLRDVVLRGGLAQGGHGGNGGTAGVGGGGGMGAGGAIFNQGILLLERVGLYDNAARGGNGGAGGAADNNDFSAGAGGGGGIGGNGGNGDDYMDGGGTTHGTSGGGGGFKDDGQSIGGVASHHGDGGGFTGTEGGPGDEPDCPEGCTTPGGTSIYGGDGGPGGGTVAEGSGGGGGSYGDGDGTAPANNTSGSFGGTPSIGDDERGGDPGGRSGGSGIAAGGGGEGGGGTGAGGGAFGGGGGGAHSGGGGGGVGGGGGGGSGQGGAGAGGFGGGGGGGAQSGRSPGDGGFGGGGGGGGDGTKLGRSVHGGGTGSAAANLYGGGGGLGAGGALFNHWGTVTFISSTLALNTVSGGAGGAGAGDGEAEGEAVFNMNGTVNLRFSTLTATAMPSGKLVEGYKGSANGSAPDPGGTFIMSVVGGVTYNAGLVANNTPSISDPDFGQFLGALTDSGGGVLTHSPLSDGSAYTVASPACDTAPDDQLGTPRGPGCCSVGAIEIVIADEGDGIPSCLDNCPADINADQANGDGDRFGDACDTCPDQQNDVSQLACFDITDAGACVTADVDLVDGLSGTVSLLSGSFFDHQGTPDVIAAGVELSKGAMGPVFNAGATPIEWAAGTCDAPTTAFAPNLKDHAGEFDPVVGFESPCGGTSAGMKHIQGHATCMRVVGETSGIDIFWLGWECAGGGNGFTYVRRPQGSGLAPIHNRFTASDVQADVVLSQVPSGDYLLCVASGSDAACAEVTTNGQAALAVSASRDFAGPDLDTDLIGECVDTCPGLKNDDQADGDGDGAGDVCDSCPTISNPAQSEVLGCFRDVGPQNRCVTATVSVTPDFDGDIVLVPHLAFLHDGTPDAIEADVFLTRDSSGPVYNGGSAAVEWAAGTCDAPISSFASNLKAHSGLFTQIPGFTSLCTGSAPTGMRNIPGHATCMHVLGSDAFYDILWTSWECGQQGPGFSYFRTDPDAQPVLTQAYTGASSAQQVDITQLADGRYSMCLQVDTATECTVLTKDGSGVLALNSASDPSGIDLDSDTVPACLDNCPGVQTADVTDSDSDGHGDACDVCPTISNPDQADPGLGCISLGVQGGCEDVRVDLGQAVTDGALIIRSRPVFSYVWDNDFDEVETGVQLTRGINGGHLIINGGGTTRWAVGPCSAPTSTFQDRLHFHSSAFLPLPGFDSGCSGMGAGGMRNIPGYTTCLHVTDSDTFYDVSWLTWGCGNDGNFSYERTDPATVPQVLATFPIVAGAIATQELVPALVGEDTDLCIQSGGTELCVPFTASLDLYAGASLIAVNDADNPLGIDLDADNAPECLDVCPGDNDPDQMDDDSDGLGDVCDICPTVANPAQDEDVACIELSYGSSCIETRIELVADSVAGDVTLGGVPPMVPFVHVGTPDVIEPGVELTKNSSDAVYNGGNAAIEWAVGPCVSPTTSYETNIKDLSNAFAELPGFPSACSGGGSEGMRFIPGHTTCLHVPGTNNSYDVFWLSWECGETGSGFSYTRSLYRGPPGPPFDLEVPFTESMVMASADISGLAPNTYPLCVTAGGAQDCVDVVKGVQTTLNLNQQCGVSECSVDNGGCPSGAVCMDTHGGHSCVCDNDGDGACAVIDAGCAEATCQTDTGQGLDNCLGLTNDQTNSDTDDHGDACDNCPLVANADQANANGDEEGDACQTCPGGPEAVDGFCVDVDECANGSGAGGHTCDAAATCTNVAFDVGTGRGYTCACLGGYTGDGFSCTDIDECELDTDGCAAGSTCMNTTGSHSCVCDSDGDSACDVIAAGCAEVTCQTDVGQVLDNCLGLTNDQTNSDADDRGDDCDNCPLVPNADQADANTDDQGDACQVCDAGYEADAGFCVDIDECARDTDDCDPQAVCSDTEGAFTCTCPAGSYGTGQVCAGCDSRCATCDGPTGASCTSCPMGVGLVNGACGPEDCATVGDEDFNGQADCEDAACGAFPSCLLAGIDSDMDGVSNAGELLCGTDPTSAAETPTAEDIADPDADGVLSCVDVDDDNDGFDDDLDVFPLDPLDWVDSDGDGVGDNRDAFPNDPTESLDTDFDGIGNNADPDDDADDVLDADDNCPTVTNDQNDQDSDGLGNVCDPDIDGDGVANDADGCPRIADPQQRDLDGDGLGDICDVDDDNDGVVDG